MEQEFKQILNAPAPLYNGRNKLYPTAAGGEDLAQILICSKPIFNPNRVEKKYKSEKNKSIKSGDETSVDLNIERSKRRAKARLYDIAMCTLSFKYFVTLTLSSDKVERDNYKDIIKTLSQWLDNAVRRKSLAYVLVPEFHADGKNIHFHGFFNEALPLVDSGHKTKAGQIIYNLPSYKLGFSTAIEFDDKRIDKDGSRIAICRYILKYINKNDQRVGGRFYLSGGALGEPRYDYFFAEFSDIDDGFEFKPPNTNIAFKCKKYLWFFLHFQFCKMGRNIESWFS